MRRTNGTGTEDDLLAIDGMLLVSADDPQSHCSTALEDDPDDKAMGADGQTSSIARWVEVAHGRTHAHAAVDVEGKGPDARGIRLIVIRAIGEPSVSTCPVEGVLLGAPFVGLMPAAAYGAIRTVEFISEVSVRLQLSQIGKYLLVPPLGVPPLRPSVEVLRHSAKKLSVVDSAGSTRDPSTRDIDPGVVRGSGAKIPNVSAIPDCLPGPVGVPHHVGHLLKCRIVPSGFKKQNRPVTVFR